MGGIETKEHKLNKDDRRVKSTNEEIDATIIELAALHLDEPSFSAREVASHIGKPNSHGIITRDRGGLKNYIISEREEFIHSLEQLVALERLNFGKVSALFCRKLGMLIVSYRMLFALDVITHSHRNTEFIIASVSPLIHQKGLVVFGAELYIILQEWQKDQFRNETIWIKYGKRLQNLIHHYQITRPQTPIITNHNTSNSLPPNGRVF